MSNLRDRKPGVSVDARVLRQPLVERLAQLIGPLLLLAVVVAPRLLVASRQGLWADEVFSLAMATGHSLEHPAALATASMGDYVEAARPQNREAIAVYLRHDVPAASPHRVVRAVLRSDTSPPLYYLGLWGWTLIFGTTDWSIRALSIAWAIACVPLIWSLAREIGGRRAAILSVILFALDPAAIFFSTEARMYSMVWFMALATGWLTLRLHRLGLRLPILLLWTLSAASGLLTHYFFAFVLCALAGWLIIRPGKMPRWALLGASAAVVLLVLPWFRNLGVSLNAWRVTQGWLEERPYHYHLSLAVWGMFWAYFSPAGPWGGRGDALWLGYVGAIGAALIAAGCGKPRQSVTEYSVPLFLWLAAAIMGPVAFDLLKHTYATSIPRYALAGLPAAIILVAVLAASVERAGARWLCVGLLLLGWTGGLRRLHATRSRNNESWRETAQMVDTLASPGSVVVIHSIPSGVIGVSRYMRSSAPVAGWVQQLGLRKVPKDIASLAGGYRRVILVVTHEVGAPTPERQWLDHNARPASAGIIRDNARIYVYEPLTGNFFPDSTPGFTGQ